MADFALVCENRFHGSPARPRSSVSGCAPDGSGRCALDFRAPFRAAALPLNVTNLQPEDDAPARRFPLVALVLAVVLGLGLGVPIATTYVASQLADPGAAITGNQDSGR